MSEHSSDTEPGVGLSGHDLDDLPLAEALREAARRLKSVGIESARADAEPVSYTHLTLPTTPYV